MSHLRVLICRVDDEANPDKTTELHSVDLPGVDPGQMQPETALDELEAGVLAVGQDVMRHLMKSQWEEVDLLPVEAYQRRFPSEAITRDGHETLRMACRLGVVYLPRQVCYNEELETHEMPGNAVLPAHNGMVITRNSQEWACLLPLDLPFAIVEWLLAWQTHMTR